MTDLSGYAYLSLLIAFVVGMFARSVALELKARAKAKKAASAAA